MHNSIFEFLQERGYIYQTTSEEIKNLLNTKKITFYLGIDPTADSLHIGHFFALMMFAHLQEAGHRGIIIIGGATALVGDPSGKSDMRKMISKEEVAHNIEEVKTLVKRFIKTDGDNPALILDNADWINQFSYIDFMRDVGIFFNVNQMLAAETYANRLAEGGLTFLEMGYMLMQAYDFVYLNRQYNCQLQIGGSDQWGNIVAGVNLNRRQNFSAGNASSDIFGLTCPLLMTKDGKKMGKSENGTLWVAREKTTAYDFYQYFYNVKDEDVEMLLKLFTRVPTAEINSLCVTDIVKAKKIMATEITKLVHGDEETNHVLSALASLFGTSTNLDNVPSFKIKKEIIEQGIGIIDLLVSSNFISTKSEARRMIEQGGIYLNGNRIDNFNLIIGKNNVSNASILLQKGKKTFLNIELV